MIALIAVCLAFIFLREGAVVYHDWGGLLVYATALPAGAFIYPPHVIFFNCLHAGFYYFGPLVLGKVIGAVCPPRGVYDVTAILQLGLWVAQVLLFYRLAWLFSFKRQATPYVAALLFAWGVPLFYIADFAFAPTASIGRSMGLTAALFSLVVYFGASSGIQEGVAWAVAALGVYAHFGPCVTVLMYYTLLEVWEAVDLRNWYAGPERAADLACHLIQSSVILIPVIRWCVTRPPLPAELESYVYHDYGTALWTYGWSSWVLTIVGAAIVVLAARQRADTRTWQVLWIALGLFIVRYLVRAVWWPLHLPLAGVALAMTAGFNVLAVAHYVGLCLVADWLCETFGAEWNGGFVTHRFLFAGIALNFCLFGWKVVYQPTHTSLAQAMPHCGREQIRLLYADVGAAAQAYADECRAEGAEGL